MSGQADGTELTQWLANVAAGDSASLAPATAPEEEGKNKKS